MASGVADILNCELPIQLAPMGSVSVSPALPLAVARAGGHGMYPGLVLKPEQLAPVLDALAAETRAFGVNFIVGLIDRGALELAAEKAPYVDFFLAAPDPELVGVIHAAGGVCGWQVESGEEARAAEAAGCDVVIAKGSESGGRKSIEGPALLPLLDAVLSATALPVIAAGGIASARGVAAVLAAGAIAARVGTRFIASEESDAHPDWIQGVLAAEAIDSVVTTEFNTGLPERRPHRVLRSSIRAAEALDGDAGVVRLAGMEMRAPRFGPLPPTRESSGTVAAMPFYAGQSAGAVTRIEPAAAIVADLASRYAR